MNYESLDKHNFDALVTGELTHMAIWLEDELNDIILDYFVDDSSLRSDFRRLLLLRDGLTAQDKIEIVRSMLPLFGLSDDKNKIWKDLLKRIEEFKSNRNALAHGLDVTTEPYLNELVVEVVTRAGAARQVKITPESHKKMLAAAEKLLEEVKGARVELFA